MSTPVVTSKLLLAAIAPSSFARSARGGVGRLRPIVAIRVVISRAAPPAEPLQHLVAHRGYAARWRRPQRRACAAAVRDDERVAIVLVGQLDRSVHATSAANTGTSRMRSPVHDRRKPPCARAPTSGSASGLSPRALHALRPPPPTPATRSRRCTGCHTPPENAVGERRNSSISNRLPRRRKTCTSTWCRRWRSRAASARDPRGQRITSCDRSIRA